MSNPICEKCGSPMLVHRAQTVKGAQVVTVRCVGCGMEREIRFEQKPEELRQEAGGRR